MCLINVSNTYIQMDDTLISTVYSKSVTSRVHEKFLLKKKTQECLSADIFGVGSDQRSVWGILIFFKSSLPSSLGCSVLGRHPGLFSQDCGGSKGSWRSPTLLTRCHLYTSFSRLIQHSGKRWAYFTVRLQWGRVYWRYPRQNTLRNVSIYCDPNDLLQNLVYVAECIFIFYVCPLRPF